jgi:hypothetical protein
VEWTTVGSKSHKSYADAVRNPPRSVFLHLNYPKNYQRNFLDPSDKSPPVSDSSNSQRFQKHAIEP